LLHLVGLTRHFILRLHDHTNVLFTVRRILRDSKEIGSGKKNCGGVLTVGLITYLPKLS